MRGIYLVVPILWASSVSTSLQFAQQTDEIHNAMEVICTFCVLIG